MKKNRILLLALLSIGCAFSSFAHDGLKFEINKVLPFISIQENELATISVYPNPANDHLNSFN